MKNNNLIIYQTSNGSLELSVDNKNETIWANRMQMAEIFDVNPQAISKHILKIYKENELDKFSTSSKMELVKIEKNRNVKRKIDYYNLEMVISVGYRINSIKATKFRQWATNIIKQHIAQGFSINQKIIEKNKTIFLQTLEDLKLLSNNNQSIETKDILSLIQSFSNKYYRMSY